MSTGRDGQVFLGSGYLSPQGLHLRAVHVLEVKNRVADRFAAFHCEALACLLGKISALTVVKTTRCDNTRIRRGIYPVVEELGYCLPFANQVLELEHFVFQGGYLLGNGHKVAIATRTGE